MWKYDEPYIVAGIRPVAFSLEYNLLLSLFCHLSGRLTHSNSPPNCFDIFWHFVPFCCTCAGHHRTDYTAGVLVPIATLTSDRFVKKHWGVADRLDGGGAAGTNM